MAIIDSFAAFRDRASQFGIEEADINKLKAKKFASYGAFTFIAVYNAQASDDAALKAALTDVLEREPSIPDMGRFRRLHFEANAVTIADAKRRHESTSDDTPKKVPAAERASRHDEQVRRLSGMVMTTSIEPSHQLLDKIQQQLEENQTCYIHPESCTSRQQEISGQKKDPGVTTSDSKTPVGSDYVLRLAFRRRALGYDQTGLISYATMEIWHERLFAAMAQDPPPDYNYVTKAQVISTDKEMWLRIMEKCRSGILPVADALSRRIINPIEQAMKELWSDPTILCFLSPLPKPVSRSLDSEMNDEERDRKRRNKGQPKGPGRNSKGSGKGRGGKGAGKGNKLPPALAGAWKIVKGQPGCRWFNMAICTSDAAPGEKCSQGIHLCMSPGCGEPHPFISCPKQRKGKGKEI